jgi:hypothetical protein
MDYKDLPGLDVVEVMRTVLPLLHKFDEDTVSTGLIAAAVVTQKPKISPDRITEVVKAVSEFIVTYIQTMDVGVQ